MLANLEHTITMIMNNIFCDFKTIFCLNIVRIKQLDQTTFLRLMMLKGLYIYSVNLSQISGYLFIFCKGAVHLNGELICLSKVSA